MESWLLPISDTCYQIVLIMIANPIYIPISLKFTYVFFHRIMNYLYST